MKFNYKSDSKLFSLRGWVFWPATIFQSERNYQRGRKINKCMIGGLTKRIYSFFYLVFLFSAGIITRRPKNPFNVKGIRWITADGSKI